jgi:hypothetical protein
VTTPRLELMIGLGATILADPAGTEFCICAEDE